MNLMIPDSRVWSSDTINNRERQSQEWTVRDLPMIMCVNMCVCVNIIFSLHHSYHSNILDNQTHPQKCYMIGY